MIVRSARRHFCPFILGLMLAGIVPGLAAAAGDVPASDAPASAVGPVMKLLRDGKVPAGRLPSIIDVIGARGNAFDLQFLWEQVLAGEWPAELRRQAMQQLVDAARNRKVLPSGELGRICELIAIAEGDAELRRAAVELAGAAQIRDALDAVEQLAADPQAALSLRAAALTAAADTDAERARPLIDLLSRPEQPGALRAAAISALSRIDLDAAAARTVAALAASAEADVVTGLLDAVLARQHGAERLAAAFEQQPPTADAAKLALRHMYAVGRNDAVLVELLSRCAGFDAEPAPPTPEEIALLVDEVQRSGDPARGEAVFRRADLSCMKCHSVSGAGGQVGPDLSAVGTISPVDYLANSVLNPDLAIKEQYRTRTVVTLDGLVMHGIVADRTADRLVLKDAAGQLVTISASDIDEELEGKSLMPKGLVRFMTRAELVDVLRFLAELGRPGPWAIRTTPRMQRFRVLVGAAQDESEPPNDEQFEARIFRADGWTPMAARVNGQLPLDEAQRLAGGPVVYCYGELEVTEGGDVDVRLDSPEGVSLWLEDDSLPPKESTRVPLTPGRHRITLRIDCQKRSTPYVVLEFARVSGSSAEFRPVDGQ